jgi:hypothetical protein
MYVREARTKPTSPERSSFIMANSYKSGSGANHKKANSNTNSNIYLTGN